MKTLPLILIGLMACLAIGISTARGQAIVYSLEDLGVVKDMETSEPSAINNQGNVAGTGYGGSEQLRLQLRLPYKIHGGCRRRQQPRIRYQLHEHGSGRRLLWSAWNPEATLRMFKGRIREWTSGF